MKWKVTVVGYFEVEEDARVAMRGVKRWLPRSVVVNVGELVEERSFGQLERCYHDEGEGRPCELVERVEG